MQHTLHHIMERDDTSRSSWRHYLLATGGVVLCAGLMLVAGWLLPAPGSPVRLHNQIDIGRTPVEVFAYATTPGNWPKWHPASLAVAGAIDHPLGLGEQVSEEYLVAGRRGRATWTVTQHEAPHLWVIEGRGTEGGTATIRYRLSETSAGTRFERDLAYRVPNLLTALLDPWLTRDTIAAESERALRQLKRRLEAGDRAAADDLRPDAIPFA